MLIVILLNIILLGVFLLWVIVLSIILLRVVLLNVILLCAFRLSVSKPILMTHCFYLNCHYSDWHSAKCHCTEFHSTKCYSSVCHPVKCCSTVCHSTVYHSTECWVPVYQCHQTNPFYANFLLFFMSFCWMSWCPKRSHKERSFSLQQVEVITLKTFFLLRLVSCLVLRHMSQMSCLMSERSKLFEVCHFKVLKMSLFHSIF